MKKLFFALVIGGALIATSCGKKCNCTSSEAGYPNVEVNLNDYKLLGVKLYNNCKDYQDMLNLSGGDYKCK